MVMVVCGGVDVCGGGGGGCVCWWWCKVVVMVCGVRVWWWIEVGVECDFVFYFGPKLDLLLSTNGPNNWRNCLQN